MPIFVIFLARGGIVTPTEIGVFAVVYALAIGSLVYRDLTPGLILCCIIATGIMTGVIMLVIMGSSVLQYILSFESVPENLANWLLTTLDSPWTIILAMNLLMIVIGTFLYLPAAVLSLALIFIGVAPEVGLDPVQLGVIMVVNLAIGLYIPPVRTALFVSERITQSRTICSVTPPSFAASLRLPPS